MHTATSVGTTTKAVLQTRYRLTKRVFVSFVCCGLLFSLLLAFMFWSPRDLQVNQLPQGDALEQYNRDIWSAENETEIEV